MQKSLKKSTASPTPISTPGIGSGLPTLVTFTQSTLPEDPTAPTPTPPFVPSDEPVKYQLKPGDIVYVKPGTEQVDSRLWCSKTNPMDFKILRIISGNYAEIVCGSSGDIIRVPLGNLVPALLRLEALTPLSPSAIPFTLSGAGWDMLGVGQLNPIYQIAKNIYEFPKPGILIVFDEQT